MQGRDKLESLLNGRELFTDELRSILVDEITDYFLRDCEPIPVLASEMPTNDPHLLMVAAIRDFKTIAAGIHPEQNREMNREEMKTIAGNAAFLYSELMENQS